MAKNIEKPKEYKRLKFSVSSNHESDLNKTLATIEKASVSEITDEILSSNKAEKARRILDHVETLEGTIPVLTNIMIAGVSIRDNISNRAHKHLQSFIGDLQRCSRELANLSKSDKTLIKTPINTKLKKLLNYDGSNYSSSYINTEIGNIQPCEVHTFNDVAANGVKHNSVHLYTFKNKSVLCIASVINSNFTPKCFDSIKINELDNWLKLHNLKD